MKSPSEIITNTNESLINLPSDSDQVSNSSTSKNSTEQNCMNSLLEITSIVYESSPKIVIVTGQVSNSTLANNKILRINLSI